ncbi:ficolin-1-like isoform X2 [Ostrea edulis]|uniref:ficolin-1-like isoform X2 n=1 Tax=Ostrea edulis TaxID=37623 RepID=UPI0024AFF333|nr:ficolin-1-like isoform X2 [Ostrea edulis]
MIDDKLRNFSLSVNEEMGYIRTLQNSSNEQLLKISSKLSSGNDAINALTRTKDQELLIVLTSFSENAQYSTFYVGDEESKYNLTVSGYSGTTGDSLTSHNGMRFSTYDNNNDKNCARLFQGGWWYSDCGDSDLNRNYRNIFGFRRGIANAWEGVTWLLGTVMMTRPKSS